MTSPTDQPQQIAVWYFIAATFVFAAPATFSFADLTWLRITALVLGFVLVVLGGIRLGVELRVRRTAKGAPGA